MTADMLPEPNTDASAECAPNPSARKALLDNRDDDDAGRDTRRVSRDELIAAGHAPMSPLKAIRARCVDCCVGELSQVRRCAHLDCPSWPYRMGTNPWQAPLSAEVLEARTRGGRRRAAQFEKSAQGGSPDTERTLAAATLPAEPSAPRNPSPEQDFQPEAGGGLAR